MPICYEGFWIFRLFQKYVYTRPTRMTIYRKTRQIQLCFGSRWANL